MRVPYTIPPENISFNFISFISFHIIHLLFQTLCFTEYMDTVFGSHDPEYYTTSGWLGPEHNQKERHTWRPLCFGSATQGDQCIWIPWSNLWYYFRLAWPSTKSKITPYRKTTVFWNAKPIQERCALSEAAPGYLQSVVVHGFDLLFDRACPPIMILVIVRQCDLILYVRIRQIEM